MYHGDIRLGDTLDIKFTTFDASGAPITLAGSPVVSAYPGNSTTEITAGITLSVDFDGRTGLHNLRIVATAGNGYAAGTNYALVITTGTIDTVNAVGTVVAAFSIQARVADVAAISGDATAADNLEAMLDGTGGVKLMLSQVRIDSTEPGGAVDIDNNGGPAISARTSVSSGDAVEMVSAVGDGRGLSIIGVGNAPGVNVQGGATGPGFQAVGNGTQAAIHAFAGGSGAGIRAFGSAGGSGLEVQGSADSPGLRAVGGSGNGAGIQGLGSGTAAGIHGSAGGTGAGLRAASGGGGNGMEAQAVAGTGRGFLMRGNGTAKDLDAKEIDALQTDTDDLQTRLPAALTAGGHMKSDLLALNGSLPAAALQSYAALGIVSALAVAGTLSATAMTTDLTEATNDHYRDRALVWLTGVLAGLAVKITAYTGATKLLTYSATPTGEAPTAGDRFIVV
jgi:hypothetical protein